MGLIFRILGTLILVLIVIVVMVVGLLIFLPAEQYAEIAEQRLEAATGRDVRIEGEVRLALWPELGFRTGPVTVANAPWSESGVIFRARALAIGVDPRTLFGGDLRITRMEATAPEILLESAADGRNNWDIRPDSPDEGLATVDLPGAVPGNFTLEEAVITDGQIVIVDHGAGSRFDLSGLDLHLAIPDLRGITNVEMSAELNGRPFSVTGTVRDIASLANRQPVPVRIDVAVDGSRVTLDGMAGLGPLRMDGSFDADIAELSSIPELAGLEMPLLSSPPVRDIVLAGKIVMDKTGRISVRDGVMTLQVGRDGNRIDLADVSAGMNPPGADGTASLDFTASVNGQEISLGGTAGIPAGTTGGQSIPLSLDLAIAGNSAKFEGSTGRTPLDLDGQFDVRITDTAALESLSGIDLAGLRTVIGDEAELGGGLAYSGSDGLELTGIRFGHAGQAGTPRQEFPDIDLRLRPPDANGRTGFELGASVNGRSLEASGSFGSLAGIPAGQPVPVVAEISAAGNRATLEIDVSLAPFTAQGKMKAEISDMAALLSMTDREVPGLQGLFADHMSLEGRISFTETGLFVLEDGRIAFGGRSRPVDLAGVRLNLLLPGSDGMAGVELVAMMNGEALTIGGSTGNIGALVGNSTAAVSLHVALGRNRINLEGEAGLAPLTARGRLEADISDLPSLLAALGRQPDDLLKSLDSGISVAGEFVIDDAGRLGLTSGQFRLGDNVIRGDIVFDPGQRALLSAFLAGDTLDLSFLNPDSEASFVTDTARSGGGSGWSNAPIDVQWLQAADARIALSFRRLLLGGIEISPVQTTTLLDTGRAVTEIGQMSVFGGSIAGQFVINSRGGLSVRAILRGRNLDFGRALAELADYHRLSANGDFEVSMLGVGDTEHDIMNSLSGQVALRLGPGRYRGLDVEAMLRDLDLASLGEGRQTEFDRVEASMTVNDGVAVGDDLVLAAPRLLVSGDGRIGVGARAIDYRISTSLLDENSEIERSVPLTIRGSWMDPKVRLDVAGYVERDLLSRLPEVEDRAREAVERKIAEEVGSAIGKVEEQIEDALVDELKDRVGEGLLNLLGGN